MVYFDSYDLSNLLKALQALNKIEATTQVAVAHGSLQINDTCIPMFYNAAREEYVIEWPQ